jgi:hypothetical protein
LRIPEKINMKKISYNVGVLDIRPTTQLNGIKDEM